MSAAIPGDARPHLPRGVRLRQDPARDAWLLLAPETLFELNQSSLEILRRCDGARSVAEIVDELAAAFGADRALVERDTVALLSELRAKRLIDL